MFIKRFHLREEVKDAFKENPCSCIESSPDCKYLSIAIDRDVRLYRPGDFALNQKKKYNDTFYFHTYIHAQQVSVIKFGSDGKYLAAGTESGHLTVYNQESRQPLHMAPLKSHTGPIKCIVFEPLLRKYLITGGRDAKIVIWDFKNGIRVNEL